MPTELGRDRFGATIQASRPGTTQVVTVGASTAVTTNAVGSGSMLVRVVSTTDCFIAIGTAPTATTSSMFLPSGVVEYFRCNPATDKIAVLQSTAGGVLYVTEML